MYQTKLLRIIESLSADDLKKVTRFIRNAYAKGSVPDLIFGHLRRQYPHLDSPKVDKEYVISRVMKLAVSNATKKRLSNEAYKLFEEVMNYLVQKKIDSDRICRNQIELSVLRSYKLDDLFYRKADELKTDLLSKTPSERNFMWLADLEHQRYFYGPTEKMETNVPELGDGYRYLEAYYQLAHLKYQVELYNRRNVLHEPGSLPDRVPTDALPLDLLGFNRLYELYTSLALLNQEGKLEHYEQLKKILKTEAKLLVREDQLILLSYLINYANKQFRQGEISGVQDAFRFYRFGAEHEILLESGLITVGNFRNAVYAACPLGKFDWAETFVANFADNLPARYKEGTVQLVTARIAFGKGKYEEVVDLLNKAAQKEYTNRLMARFLLVQVYYELPGQFGNILKPFIKTFEAFLNRNKLHNPMTTKAFSNFLQILKLIIRPKNRPKVAEIKERLLALKPIAGQEWLLEKIAALPE